jgi:hypothetical protein
MIDLWQAPQPAPTPAESRPAPAPAAPPSATADPLHPPDPEWQAFNAWSKELRYGNLV